MTDFFQRNNVAGRGSPGIAGEDSDSVTPISNQDIVYNGSITCNGRRAGSRVWKGYSPVGDEYPGADE